MNVDQDSAAARGLARYVAAVAAAVEVPLDAVGYEVSERAYAYLALNRRVPAAPDHDLMLLWDEVHGWSVGVETDPGEEPIMLAYLGSDVLAEPAQVKEFVGEVLLGRRSDQPHAVASSDQLATSLALFTDIPTVPAA